MGQRRSTLASRPVKNNFTKTASVKEFAGIERRDSAFIP
jgi:hypothetical protein